MTGKIDARLIEMGIALGSSVVPVANYVPFVRTGNLVFVSGQITLGPNGVEYIGQLGREISLDQGKAAARLCATNVLAVLKTALDGDLDRVKRVVKVTGFVNAAPGFAQHPDVINGASDFFVAVFGDAGRHARASVGASSLPRNVAVEVEAIFEVA